MTDEKDPLDDADVGDTVTVQNTVEFWAGDLESEHCFGSDRFGHRKITETEIYRDDHGEEHLRVTVESELTKQLPRLWDVDASGCDSEQSGSRMFPRSLPKHVVTMGTLGLVTAVSMWSANHMLEAADLTINGEPMIVPGPELGVALFVFAIVLYLGIVYAPGMVGRPIEVKR